MWSKEYKLDDSKSESKCLHMGCKKCNGTGRTERGEPCVHFISCPCKKCNPCTF